MKRRRRNPQAGKPPPHSRSLLRQALLQKLDLDFKLSRQYHSERPKTWQSGSSSDSQELSAASSLDRYVKAVLSDGKCTEEKDDTDGARRQRRNHTPASEDINALRQGQGLISSSLLHMNRIEEYSTSAFSTSGEHPMADWARHGYDHNHHQLSGFQIRDQEGGWEHVRVVLDLNSRHSLVNEDTVRRLGISLIPMRPGLSPSTYTCLGPVESTWFATAQMRTLADMSPVSVHLMSTKLLPASLDILAGEDLLEMLGGLTVLPFMTMGPECLNWTSSEPLISTYPTTDPTWPPDDGANLRAQFTREDLDHPQCPVSQLDSNLGSSWSGLCGSTIELSSNFEQYQRQEPGVL